MLDPLQQEMVTEVDANGNGTIDFDEFLTLVAREKDETEEELREAFIMIAKTKGEDDDSKLYTPPADLKKMMSDLGMSLTDEDVDEMIAVADLDRDGKINYEEFLDLLRG